MRARIILSWTPPGFDISVGQSEQGFVSHCRHTDANDASTVGGGVFRHAGQLHLTRI